MGLGIAHNNQRRGQLHRQLICLADREAPAQIKLVYIVEPWQRDDADAHHQFGCIVFVQSNPRLSARDTLLGAKML